MAAIVLDRVIDVLFKPDVDTAYVEQNDYRLLVRPYATENFSQIDLRWRTISDTMPSFVNLSTQPITKVGLSLGYRSLSIGYDVDITNFHNSRPQNTEFDISFYGQTLGIDFTLNQSQQHLATMRGSNLYIYGDALRTKSWKINSYYVVNNRKFSYPAALTQSYRQKRTAGSLLVGLSLDWFKLESNQTLMPEAITKYFCDVQLPNLLKCLSLNLGLGYARNFVLGRQSVNLHFSVMPNFSVLRDYTVQPRISYHDLRQGQFGYGMIACLAALWQKENHYFGTTINMTFNTVLRSPFYIDDVCARASVFYGFRAYRLKHRRASKSLAENLNEAAR